MKRGEKDATVSRRWPLTALASLIGVSTIAAPTLVAIFLVDRSGAIGAPSGRAGVSALGAVGPVATADDVTPSSSPSVAILPPLLPSAPPGVTPSSAEASADAGAASLDSSDAPWSTLTDLAQTIPSTLRDGRDFIGVSVVDPHHVVGVARPATGRQACPASRYAVVVVDLATQAVTATLDSGTNSADELAQCRGVDEWVGTTTSGDWVGLLSGVRGDDEAFADATISVANVVTGKRIVLERVPVGEFAAGMLPMVSGDRVAWGDGSAIHVYSLSQAKETYTLKIAEDASTYTHLDALAGPLLDYNVSTVNTSPRPTMVTPPATWTPAPDTDLPKVTHHAIDLRTGVDEVVPGVCDESWCQVQTVGWSSSTVSMDQRGSTSTADAREIEAGVGWPVEHASFEGAADGFYLWTATTSDTNGFAFYSYLYDPVTDRNIFVPPVRSSRPKVTGHYVVWGDSVEYPGSPGPIRFADLDALRAALTTR